MAWIPAHFVYHCNKPDYAFANSPFTQICWHWNPSCYISMKSLCCKENLTMWSVLQSLVRMNIYSEFHVQISFLYFKSPDTAMYLQYYLFFNSGVYTSEWGTYLPACVCERKWNASAAETTKWGPDLDRARTSYKACLKTWKFCSNRWVDGIFDLPGSCPCSCGNVTREVMCVCVECGGDGWGEDTTNISYLGFFRFCLFCVEYNFQLEKLYIWHSAEK